MAPRKAACRSTFPASAASPSLSSQAAQWSAGSPRGCDARRHPAFRCSKAKPRPRGAFVFGVVPLGCSQTRSEERPVKTVEVGCIGVGWIGGLRAETLSRTALVDKLHLCDIKPERLAEVKAAYKPATATLDYNDIINNPNISVVFVSTTPEANHYPIARDCLKGGKHVMLEKPIALELWEADELIHLSKQNNLKFTIGYSQRFNTKIAYAKKKIVDGT